MSYYLPSYEQCLEICEKSCGLFYETVYYSDDYKISIFNYRLTTYNDFVEYKAFELRGLTFVFNQDGTVFQRYLLMEKFFNLNENESVLYDLLKHKKVNSVYLKEDGSVISFIKLPNGKVIAKSKNSIESEQAIQAQEVYESDSKLKDFVDHCLSQNLSPIFELVGPKNRIVVKYDTTQLILLRLRNNQTGRYLSINEIELPKPINFSFSLDDLISLKNELVSIEGWIVEFEDGQKIKIKTNWYYSLHRILTDYSNREDYLIDMVLDEKIDDILSVLDYGSENRLFVEKVMEKTIQKMKIISDGIDELLLNYSGDRKTFAVQFKYHKYFPIAIQVIIGRDKLSLIKEFIKKETYRLSNARDWLDF
jgi:T4 RnlA family RNA ligase